MTDKEKWDHLGTHINELIETYQMDKKRNEQNGGSTWTIRGLNAKLEVLASIKSFMAEKERAG